jgi:hypothetical protein
MPSKSSMSMVDEDTVRTRAYLMWEADGRPDGRADHYWGLAYDEAAMPAKSKRAVASVKPAPEKKAKPAKSAKSEKATAKPAKTTKKSKA